MTAPEELLHYALLPLAWWQNPWYWLLVASSVVGCGICIVIGYVIYRRTRKVVPFYERMLVQVEGMQLMPLAEDEILRSCYLNLEQMTRNYVFLQYGIENEPYTGTELVSALQASDKVVDPACVDLVSKLQGDLELLKFAGQAVSQEIALLRLLQMRELLLACRASAAIAGASTREGA